MRIKVVMISLSIFFVALAAQAQEVAAEAAPPVMNMTQFLLNTAWFGFCAFIVYWMLVLKPSQEKERRHAELIQEMKKNDEVMTSGGLIGRVRMVSSDEITIEISPKVTVKVSANHVFPMKEIEEQRSGPAEKSDSPKEKRKA